LDNVILKFIDDHVYVSHVTTDWLVLQMLGSFNCRCASIMQCLNFIN